MAAEVGFAWNFAVNSRTFFCWARGQVLRTTFLRDFRDLSQYSQQVLVFPPRQEAATVDALSFTFFLGLEQTQRHLAQPGKVLRTIAGPMSLLVLAET